MTLDHTVDVGWRRRPRPQDRRRADRERKVQAVPQSISEKQLRDTEGPVVDRDTENAAAKQLGTNDHIVMQVHTALRLAGTAGGIEPESWRVTADDLRGQLARRLRDERREINIPIVAGRSVVVDHDDLAKHASRLPRSCLNLR